MKWLNSWASGIVVSVIIATLIEMILPENKNKKYIKTVIGVFVLFSIVAPVISKVTDNSIDLNSILASSLEVEEKMESTNSLDTNKVILSTYETKLKDEMVKLIQQKGYQVSEINLEIDDSEENFGNINKVIITISEQDNSVQTVEKIEISVSEKTEEKEPISSKTEKEIKTFLAEEYQIKEDNITIN